MRLLLILVLLLGGCATVKTCQEKYTECIQQPFVLPGGTMLGDAKTHRGACNYYKDACQGTGIFNDANK